MNTKKKDIYKEVLRIKEHHKEEYLNWATVYSVNKSIRIPNVVGIGVGKKVNNGRKTEDLSIVISVIKKYEERRLRRDELIPKEIDGIPTDIIETGIIRAQTRRRPAFGGCSIGHYEITKGTFGCLVKKNNQIFILSNNHVLANLNNANIGDSVLQPGNNDIPLIYKFLPKNCKLKKYKIAELMEFIPLDFTGAYNIVDAAIAKPINNSIVNSNIENIGPPSGTITSDIDMKVKKCGATTDLTRSVIMQTDFSGRVEYNNSVYAKFDKQLVANHMCDPGDSGAVVLKDDDTNRICGLFFAGSDKVTIINPIDEVFSALNLSSVG